jgi:hypothetical protein
MCNPPSCGAGFFPLRGQGFLPAPHAILVRGGNKNVDDTAFTCTNHRGDRD